VSQEEKASKKVLVLPGDKIEGLKQQSIYVFDYNGEKRAAVLGLVNFREEGTDFVPLKGFYFPSEGDIVIGLVMSHAAANWFLDINSPYQAVLSVQDFFGVKQGGQVPEDPFTYLKIGDYVKAKIVAFDRVRSPMLTVQDKGLGRITEGTVVTVRPVKVPRIIGKKGSMIETIKKASGCDLFVAVNGRVHITCQNDVLEEIVAEAINIIEEQSHTSGLTNRIKEFIEEERKVRGI
jgi:exosome complex component RRP4